MNTSDYLEKFWTKAPFAWSIIRAAECAHLSKLNFTKPILEVGCGDGLVNQVLFMDKKGVIDAGIDLDANELALAKKTAMYRRLIKADICQAPFPAGTFYTVFANGVLEHIPNLTKALAEIARILKPGGQLITTSPSDTFTELLLYYRLCMVLRIPPLAHWYGKQVNKVFAHHHLLSLTKWKRQLENAGLTVMSHGYYNPPKIVALYDLSLPFSLGSKNLKRLTGSLVVLPNLRKYFIKLFIPLVSKYMTDAASIQRFGSIYIVAKKPK